MTWHTGIKNTFIRWSRNLRGGACRRPPETLEAGLTSRETDRGSHQQRRSDANREEGEYFFRLLGGYRGISEAALSYARAAGLINWTI